MGIIISSCVCVCYIYVRVRVTYSQVANNDVKKSEYTLHTYMPLIKLYQYHIDDHVQRSSPTKPNNQ